MRKRMVSHDAIRSINWICNGAELNVRIEPNIIRSESGFMVGAFSDC